jgi:large subunit ribosomal protein L25
MSITVKADRRDSFGKNASRRIRRNGMIPAVFYGKNEANVPLAVEKKDIFEILKSETGENTVFKLSFDTETKNTMIKEIQSDPVTDEVLHADLIQIAMDKAIRVSVPVVPVGEAVGVKQEGGFVDFITREVEIECLPEDIPENIEIDISMLHLNQSFKVGDLVMPEGAALHTDPSTILIVVEAPTKEEEIAVEEEEEELMAEEEEPEVIKKEKVEVKEEEKEGVEEEKEKGKKKEKEEEKE